jgi:hypothetical protein
MIFWLRIDPSLAVTSGYTSGQHFTGVLVGQIEYFPFPSFKQSIDVKFVCIALKKSKFECHRSR